MVDLYYSKDNFVSDNNLIVEGVAVEDESYDWFIPPDLSDTVRVKAIPDGFPSGYDISDDDFAIVDGGWAGTWGDTRNESFNGVVCDADGNSYATGEQLNSNTGYSLGILFKYNPAGQLVWCWIWGSETGGDYCAGKAIAIDDAGDLYITGYFQGVIDFDPGAGTDEHTSNGQRDVFVSKFDSDGTWIWTKTWGGNYDDEGKAITVRQSTFYVAGFYQDNVDFDPDPLESCIMGGYGATDIFTSIFDTSGSFITVKVEGGVDSDWANDVAVNSAGKIFVTGIFQGTVYFDENVANMKISNGQEDVFLVWYDTDFSFQGVETWSGTGWDRGYAVDVDGLGNVYVTGSFKGLDVDFDPGDGIDLISSAGQNDAFLTKFDSAVSYQWARTWGGSSGDYSFNVCVDGLCNVITVGTFYSIDMDFDPGSGSDLHASQGWDDAYLNVLDSFGDFVMARSWGGTDYDEAYGCAVSNTNAIFVSGLYYSSPMELAPVGAPCFEDSHQVGNNGYDDAFLSKYLPNGCLQYSEDRYEVL
ncbi:MAG: hypothetical protein ABIC40_01150 [bacterium]